MPKPQVLDQNAEIWTDQVLAAIEAGEDATSYQKSRYNRAEIKEVLVAETAGKCAYCESKVLHIDFGDIEHIIPKSQRPELWFEWNNLTLACGVCNNKKRAYFDEGLPLLDPYLDEPEDCLLFFGPLARACPGDQNAQMTERTLELNRPKLIERRTEKLDQLLALANLLNQADEPLRGLLEEDFLRETGSEREYASMARTIAGHLGLVRHP